MCALCKQSLCDEERRLIHALSTVRTRLNELTAIATLPAEILELIFAICISWLYGPQRPKSPLAWAQVCRRWRSISLNSAHLWNCIDLGDSRLANELLIRSKTTPISIISASPRKLCTDNLRSHAGRLRAIDVFLFPDNMVNLFTNIGFNLPNVTELSLKIPPVSTTLVLDVQIPRVKKLVLDCVAVTWDAYYSLTCLSLRGLGAEYSPSVDQLASIFASSPNLEFLRLESVIPTPRPNIYSRIIPLPRLRELVILAKAGIILNLLSSIAFPPTTRVQLACSSFDDVHSLLPRDRNWNVADVGTIRVDQRAVTFLRPGATSWIDDQSNLLFSITSVRSLSKSLLAGVHIIANLSIITTLEFGMEVLAHILSDVLFSFLGQAVNLQRLHVLHNDLGDLLHILTPTRITPVFCPRLEYISFSMIQSAAVQWREFNKRWVQPVLTLVEARSEYGISLAILEFRRCRGVTAHHFENFVQEIRLLDC
jgi:hypothetical protein